LHLLSFASLSWRTLQWVIFSRRGYDRFRANPDLRSKCHGEFVPQVQTSIAGAAAKGGAPKQTRLGEGCMVPAFGMS